VTIAVCLLIPLNPGFCEKIHTPQGTKKLDEIHGIMLTIVQHIRDQNTEQALAFMKDVKELWQAFTAYHEEVFTGEIIPPESTAELFTGIPGDLDALELTITTDDHDQALQKAQAILESIAALNDRLALPILFDFTGPTCKSCKVMKARLDQVAPEYAGKVRIVLVDVNVQKEITKEYKIMLIPTLIFVDESGVEIDRHVGPMEEQAIRSELADLIKQSGANKK
jgi:thioredoxin 1